jgi:hypothetical protein
MSEEKKIYPPANWQKPREGAKDWELGKVGFPVNEFIDFLNEHKKDTGWINFELKQNQEGGYYLQLDNFKPDPSKAKNKKEEDTPF